MSGRLSTRLTGNAAALVRHAPRPRLGLGACGPCSWPVAGGAGGAASGVASGMASRQVLQVASQSRPASAATRRLLDQDKPRDLEDLGRLVKVASDRQHISLFFDGPWSTGPARYLSHHYLWFRDVCQCAQCVSESSGQKTFATCDIDAVPKLDSCTIRDDGALEIVWADDFMARDSERRQVRGEPAHTSVYPREFLFRMLVRTYSGQPPEVPYRVRTIWNRDVFQPGMESRNVSYEDWMAGGPVFAKAMVDLVQWGLVIVKGVPQSKDAVKDIANKIGHLQNTFYGPTWDVISKPQAENVAYTNDYLCLHQDLMYWHEPPKIQLLHCLANESAGGDSLFSDGFRAAYEFRYQKHKHWACLKTQLVPFSYARNGNFYSEERHTITQSYQMPDRIHWSPPFQGPFRRRQITGSTKRLTDWRNAAEAFRNSLEAPENVLQYRLQPGDCVLFDNHRILHGRTQFDVSTGHRHLHGTYIDKPTMDSALQRLVIDGLLDRGDDSEKMREQESENAKQMYKPL